LLFASSYYFVGRTGVGDVKTMAGLIFDEVASFAHTKPTYLKSVSVVVHDQTMVSDFVTAVEEAEKLEGHPVKKFFGKLKGMNRLSAITARLRYFCCVCYSDDM